MPLHDPRENGENILRAPFRIPCTGAVPRAPPFFFGKPYHTSSTNSPVFFIPLFYRFMSRFFRGERPAHDIPAVRTTFCASRPHRWFFFFCFLWQPWRRRRPPPPPPPLYTPYLDKERKEKEFFETPGRATYFFFRDGKRKNNKKKGFFWGSNGQRHGVPIFAAESRRNPAAAPTAPPIGPPRK